MRKITLASALCLGLILAACGGGGSDGGSASSGNSATVSNGGTTTGGSGAGSTNTNTSGPSSSGSSTSGSNGTGNSSSTSSGSGKTTTSNSGSAGTSASGGTGTTDTTGTTGSGSTGTTGSGTTGTTGSGSTDTTGSGSTGTSNSGSSDSTSSGSSGSGSSSTGTSSGGASADTGNTIPVLVSSASTVRNYPFVSVTICKPNSSAQTSCATINNVLLDTGSFGLRLFASMIPTATLATLPVQTDASNGNNVAACAQFGSGYTWGSLRSADVKLGSEIATSVPIQVISDPEVVSRAPSSCVWNTALSTPSALGANGVLGVGVSRYDCGTNCAGATARAGYYYADANPATPIVMPLVNQVTNPVALFPVDNNGVIVAMPAVPGQGAATMTGTVIFGIDTQTNNLLAGTGATVFNTDMYGDFTGSYNGASTVTTFIDSGSNALNFQDATIPQTNSFYTPANELTRPVALKSSNGSAATVNIDIGNAATLFSSINYAFNNLAAYLAQTIDLGFPYFYGQRVYYGITGSTSSGGGTGPYVAFGAR